MKPLACVDGATCTVPAFPELVLQPESFDMIESEVIETYGDTLVYSISLSARPSERVRIHVKSEVRLTECYKHGNKLELLREWFDFGPGNYSTPQSVSILVNRLNTSAYEGSFSALFHHSVETDDEEFKSIFVRPVSLNLQDDSACSANAQKYDDESRVRKCGCTANTFIQATDPLFCESSLECTECPKGMKCGFQQNLTSAVIEEKFYRSRPDTVNVVACPLPHVCIGNGTHGDDLCKEGHESILCMVCSSGFVWSGRDCVECDGGKKAALVAMMLILMLLLLAVVPFTWPVKTNAHERDQVAKRSPKMEARWVMVSSKFKTIVSFTQIISKATNFPMRLPPDFIKFLAQFHPFAFLDAELIPFGCVLEANFHARLLMMTLLPICFLGWLLLIYCLHRVRIQLSMSALAQAHVRETIVRLEAKCLYVAIVFLYSAFPLVIATIFQTMIYDTRLESGAYLRVDYTVERTDAIHQWMVWYALTMGLVYCVGMPFSSGYMVWSRRKVIRGLQDVELRIINCPTQAVGLIAKLEGQKSKYIKDDPLLGALSYLYQDYKPGYWWWSIPDFFVKLILCGLVTVTQVSSVFQVCTAILASTMMLVALANCKPHLTRSEVLLAQLCQAFISVEYGVGLIEKVEEGDPSLTGGMLVICVAGIWILGLGSIVLELCSMYFPECMEKLERRRFGLGKNVLSKTDRFSSTVRPCDEGGRFKIVSKEVADTNSQQPCEKLERGAQSREKEAQSEGTGPGSTNDQDERNEVRSAGGFKVVQATYKATQKSSGVSPSLLDSHKERRRPSRVAMVEL